MNLFSRNEMTLKNLSYDELKNLLTYFRRSEGLFQAGTEHYHPEVMVYSTSHVFLEMDLYFNITFPKSWVETAPLDQAILNILRGNNARIEESD